MSEIALTAFQHHDNSVFSPASQQVQHDDIITWKHFLHYWLFVRVRYGISTFNSLAPGRFKFKFRWIIFKLISVNGGWGISYEIALRWMPLGLTDDKSTLIQVMAWCCQATGHYLSQFWLRYLSPNGVTRPQWVNLCILFKGIATQSFVIFFSLSARTSCLKQSSFPWFDSPWHFCDVTVMIRCMYRYMMGMVQRYPISNGPFY